MTNKSWLMFLIGSVIILAVCFAAYLDLKRPDQTLVPPREVTTETRPPRDDMGKPPKPHESSQPVQSPTTLANPASVNCANKGGTLVIQKRGDGGEYGLCMFEDAYACEEWALFRDECPVGGVRTTGFDTVAQKYCAWAGGQTYAVPNATCTFTDGSTCPDDAFYNGTCQQGQNAK